MEELIEKLNELYERPNCGRDWHEGLEDDVVVDRVAELAMQYLHSSIDGHIVRNYANVKILQEAGYRNFPGERDSFGWLIGCIQKIGGGTASHPH